MFIHYTSIHEFTSIATMHPALTAMYMPEDMDPGRDVRDNFCQVFATQMVTHRAGLIQNPERRSVSHKDTRPSTLFIPRAGVAQVPTPPSRESVLWYRQPAPIWEHALPIGNGRLGAMVFGGATYESKIDGSVESVGEALAFLNPVSP